MCRAVSFPISGPISAEQLVARLNGVQLDLSCECWHLEIGDVDDPNLLNSLLFELLIVGCLRSGII